VAGLTVLLCTNQSPASLLAQYNMDYPSPLVNSAGATFYQPNMVNPGGSASPTFLPWGGEFGGGAYQFDGVNDYLTFGGAGYLFLANNNSDWTVSFWIQTTDTGVNTSYAGTPKIPVLGNTTGGVGFGLGIDGGKATYKRYNAGWQTAQGATNVADGLPHYVTFVTVGSSNLSIWVDGQLDTANLSVPGVGFSQLGVDIGRSYAATYGAFTLDDLRVYDTALSPSEIHMLTVPEPSSLALLALVGLCFALRRRSLGN
jgi:hypothetical protein